MPQVRTDHSNVSSHIPAEDIIVTTGNTIIQDADHTGDVLELTVIARTAAGTLKNMEANDGTEFPVALLKGTIPNADIVAGNVTNVRLYKAGRYFKEADIVLENSLTLDTAIPFWDALNADLTIREALQMIGIYILPADAVAGYENS